MSVWIPQILQELNMVSVVVRLALAMLFSGIIGMERGRRQRPAGFRTYMLVCVGAALVMMTNEFMLGKFGTSDPARLGAQVINGIGFLGAGSIIVTRNQHVKGLTTAAGLWVSACMGLALGIGFYEGAAVTTVIIMVIMTTMHSFDRHSASYQQKLDVYLEMDDESNLTDLVNTITDMEINVLHIEVSQSTQNPDAAQSALLTLCLPKQQMQGEVLDALRSLDGVTHAEEV